MALVVTARAPAEASVGSLVQPGHAQSRTQFALRAVAAVGAASWAIALVMESAARAAPSVVWLEGAAVAADAVAAALSMGVCLAAWLTYRHDAGLLLSATLALVVAAIRALAVPLLVGFDQSVLADVVSLGLGLLALASLVWAVTVLVLQPSLARRVDPPLATDPSSERRAASMLAVEPFLAVRAVTPQAELFRRVAQVTTLLLFAVGLSGAMVKAVGASWACHATFPDCNGLGVLPFGRDPLADIQLYHRLLSYVALGLVAWLAVEAFRTQRNVTGLTGSSLALLSFTAIDGAIGALSVSIGASPLVGVAHTAVTAATWSTAVLLVAVTYRAPGASHAEGISKGASPPLTPGGLLSGRAPAMARVTAAYVQLTKPRVMSLLLATTAAAMVIAARGMPDLGILIATLLGGALMSGGAGAINHYVDRDIDPLMGRTAWRPIPSGVISPRAALRFGIALALIASAIFILFVNLIACVLAILGLLGYVFIYTLWLKRSTPSNIVIGGAAGAIPPLVGWAAVTNEIGSLTAWYLFAIIFFWTPPHFWALSLLIRKHYERAGVPMLPVVRGEDETRRQILLYSLLLVVLTLVLSPFGMMGNIYFGAAALLGGLFIADAVRLWREATPQAARRLYLYSILYLFALFAAMAVDRVVSS